jgi:hypothetical protein
MTTRFNANFTAETRRKLEALAKIYGGMTKALTVLIDRAWREEIKNG